MTSLTGHICPKVLGTQVKNVKCCLSSSWCHMTSSYSPPIRIVSSGEGQGKHGLTLGIREDPEYWVHWLSFHIFIAEKV